MPLPTCANSLCRLCSRFLDRKSTRLNSSHDQISYAVFCLKKKHLRARRAGVAEGTLKQSAPSKFLMENFICVHSGTHCDDAAEPPSRWPISEEERQFGRHTIQ